MSVYPQQFNDAQKTPSTMDYDLQAEKQRIADGTEEIKKELLEKWQQRYANAQIFPTALDGTNPELIKFLLSFQHTLTYTDLARKLGLNQQQRDSLPQVVWQICVGKKWEQLKVSLINYLSVNSMVADQIVLALNQNIIAKARELSPWMPAQPTQAISQPKASADNLISLTISDALKAYPELGEQAVTSERIAVMNFPEPARPSIKNWLADYTALLGRENHNAIARGNYLFHNNNTQKLNANDRQKLAYILKSFDEKTIVKVNKKTKQIIFPVNNVTFDTKPATQISSTAADKYQISNKIQSPNDQIPNTLPARRAEIQNSNDKISKPVENSPHNIIQPAQPALQTTNYKPQTNRISFSSPQKLSYEKAPITNKPTAEMKPFRPQFNQPATPTPPIRETAPLKTATPIVPPKKNINAVASRPTGWAWNTVKPTAENDHPYRITPASNRQPDNSQLSAKNIVDLKN